MANLTAELTKLAEAVPQDPALIASDRIYTFADVDEALWKIATYIVAKGAVKGDVVCLRFADDLLFTLAYFAVARIGATVHLVPRKASLDEQEAILQDVGSSICITDLDEDSKFETIILLNSEILAGLSSIDPDVMDLEPAAPLQFGRGSGSTGRPKLIPWTHDALPHRIKGYSGGIGLGPGDRVGTLLSMELGPGYWPMMNAVLSGAAFCFRADSSPQIGAWCQALGITVLSVIPGHLESLLHMDPGMLSSLRAIVPTGAPITEELRKRVR